MNLTLHVNSNEHHCDVDAEKPLLWVLREDLHLTGTKYGCGIAACGACTVLIGTDSAKTGGRMISARSCMVRAGDAADFAITTIEGLSDEIGRAVQQAWIEEDVPQCGYCQSGQIMTTVALLAAFRNGGELNDDDIDAALSGNLCRCGTYQRIRRAVRSAAGKLRIAVGGNR